MKSSRFRLFTPMRSAQLVTVGEHHAARLVVDVAARAEQRQGRSLLVVSPTGFSKTLCFQLPAVLRRRVSVVVSPLKALKGEQVSSLLRRKIPSSFINSDISADEKRLRYGLLASNSFKLLYVAPERFFVQNINEQQRLRSVRPAFLVIDEAHCVDQWGRDFRPEYGCLKEVREALGSPPILAFTATAGQEMQRRILASLGIPDAQVFVRGVDRPNIAFLRWNVSINDRPWAIEQLCRVRMSAKGKVMIFVPTRKIGMALQKYLGEHGLETPFYHSQLDKSWDREQLLKRFVGESRPEVDRVICTSAFGMGLDVPDIRLVVHWQYPFSVEEYLQGFGRAGRDGRQSLAVLFHDPANDRGLLNYMLSRQEGGEPAARQQDLEVITRLVVNRGSCFRQALLDQMQGSERKRISLAMRILKWVLEVRQRPDESSSCCDVCDRSLPEQVRAGRVARPGLARSG